MGRPKGSKNKTASKTDPNVEEMYETEVEYMCPIHGLQKQKVKVKKLKPVASDVVKQAVNSEDALDNVDHEEDELPDYDEDIT